MTKMLFVKSSDYWGYDAASFDDSVNFYRYSWVVPAAQYSSMSSDDQDRLFPCALFYVQGVTDNHNFLALSITESGSESKVSGMQGGKRRTRRYTLGSPAQYSVGTYALQEAPSGATTIADIQSAVESGSTSDGSFTVSEFLTDGTKIAEAVGMMTEDKAAESSAAFAAPASEPSGSAYLPVDPTVADPATEGYSESDLITMDDFSAEGVPMNSCVSCEGDIYNETDVSYCYECGDPYCERCANFEFSSREEDGEVVCPECVEDFDAEGDSRLRDIRGKFMNRKKAKNAVFGEIMSQQMSGYYRTGIVGDNPPVGQNIARRNPVAKARYFIEPGVQNPNSGEWSKGPNFQQARKIAKGVAWDTVQDMGLAAETAGLPVIPNSFGENSAPEDGHGVPQWYGSAETEGLPMTTLGDQEFPVLEDSYGGNTAWESGYGVPQWYGSAEEDEYLCKYCGQDPDSAFADDFWTDGVCIPCAKEHGEYEDYDAQGISKTLEEAAPVSLKKPTLMAALGLVAGIWMARR